VLRTRFSGGQNAPAKRHYGKGAGALALLLASIACPAKAAPMPQIQAGSVVHATPALWEIRDADTTIYLFGTFHTLDERTAWFGDKVRTAFDQSGELVLETIVPADQATLRATAKAEVTEVSADGTRRMKPFMAQTQSAVSQGRTIGLSVENGADTVLRRIAEGAGKPVGGLERFEDQLKTLANIPSPPPGAASAAPESAVTVTLNDLLGAWTRGDTGAFSAMLSGLEAKSPAAYKMLFADRNARWGQWISDRLQQPGVVFVAVGSGHLVGKDSVQQWLAARGITATRIG
jgi:uncharacterized protein YbaP (TraB family)